MKSRLHEPEDGFMQAVRELAQWHRYLTYHTLRSTGSAPGFPDLIMARAGRPLLCIETKRQRGSVTQDQQAWLAVLPLTRGICAEVWRPDDWDRLTTILQGAVP